MCLECSGGFQLVTFCACSWELAFWMATECGLEALAACKAALFLTSSAGTSAELSPNSDAMKTASPTETGKAPERRDAAEVPLGRKP